MSRNANIAATRHVRDACLCLHTQRAARMLSRKFDDAFRPLDLTSGQFSLLNALNRNEPAGMSDVAALLGMDRTTLTAALKPLERNGFVESSRDPSDRRRRKLALTRAGRKVLASAMPVWRRVHREVEKGLGDAGRLRSDLRALH
ncbi:MAG: MarR family winged helix-turn-helix transcriptional regulator [Rhizomicrobium sp.]|jgi:DNA-binding MarR family transcriptional regulator